MKIKATKYEMIGPVCVCRVGKTERSARAAANWAVRLGVSAVAIDGAGGWRVRVIQDGRVEYAPAGDLLCLLPSGRVAGMSARTFRKEFRPVKPVTRGGAK